MNADFTKALSSILDILRTGSLATRLNEFVNALYVILGIALGYFLPYNMTSGFASAANDDLSALDVPELDECYAALSEELALQKQCNASVLAAAPTAFDPATILIFIELGMKVIEMIRKWRQNRKNPAPAPVVPAPAPETP